MTKREKAAIRRRRPAEKDRCVHVMPVRVHYVLTHKGDLPEKLRAIARILRSLANDCDNTADSLQ